MSRENSKDCNSGKCSKSSAERETSTNIGDIPADLIDASTAAKIAKVHVTGITRWVNAKKLRGWNRVGRLFVSRAEVVALFEPVSEPVAPMNRTEKRRHDNDRKARHEAAMKQLSAK